MLGDITVRATIAVKDMSEAREFYTKVLGLHEGKDFPGGTTYRSGDAELFVYESQTGGTGQATTASWPVDDIETIVKDLKDKGVTFEHYDMPGATLDRDISVMGDEKAAWFKDPSGNVLALVQSV